MDKQARDTISKHIMKLDVRYAIDEWYDRLISAGSSWLEKIMLNIETSDVILLLISENYLSSDFCYSVEMQKAVSMSVRGKPIVIPVILSDCDWKETPLARLQALPWGGKAIDEWSDNDAAYRDVAESIGRAIMSAFPADPSEDSGRQPVVTDVSDDTTASSDQAADPNIKNYELIANSVIPEISSEARLFKHTTTGARFYHLYNNDSNNLFCPAFRTPVANNLGAVAALRHMVLCGSRKYPVKDPFKELLTSSLQTSINALSYPDRIIFPLSSKVEKDFFNIVDVYCDAIFHPLLRKNDFYREAWHLHMDGPRSAPYIKGIVYDMMARVYANPESHVERKLFRHLLPDTVYTFESAGVPECIVDLTYEDVLEYHRIYFHPSNCWFFLYGNIPTEKTLMVIHRNYLSTYKPFSVSTRINRQPLWKTPRAVNIPKPTSLSDERDRTVVLGWIFCDTTDALMVLAGKVLGEYLLSRYTSPLRRELIDRGVGDDFHDMSGFDSELAQALFLIGLPVPQSPSSKQVEKNVMDALSCIAEKGLDREDLLESINEVEIRMLEITYNGEYPYPLRLASRCFRSWMYDGDPASHIDLKNHFDTLRIYCRQHPQYFSNLIRDRMINNTHRLVATISPSPEEERRYTSLLAHLPRELTKGMKQNRLNRIYALSKELDDESKNPFAAGAVSRLPRIQKRDLPPAGNSVDTEIVVIDGIASYLHPVFTNGIHYLDVIMDCTSLPTELLPFLPLFSELVEQQIDCVAHIFIGKPVRKDALPSVRISWRMKSLPDSFNERLSAFQTIVAKRPSFTRNNLLSVLSRLLDDTLLSFVRNGHRFAIRRAGSALNSALRLEEMTAGTGMYTFLKTRSDPALFDMMASALHEIHNRLIRRSTTTISITTRNPHAILDGCRSLIEILPDASPQRLPFFSDPFETDGKGVCIDIDSNVNFVAECYDMGFQDAGQSALLLVLSRFLSARHLWDMIRVAGGAYGGMALYTDTKQVFGFTSYRDPHIKKTLERYRHALQRTADGIDADSLEESIIRTIGYLDSPKSPSDLGYGETCDLLFLKTPEYRQLVRDTVLNCTTGDIEKKAQELLNCDTRSIAVFGSSVSIEGFLSSTDGFSRYKID